MDISPELQQFINTVADQYKPDRIILFGSYVKGGYGPDSDIDIIVVMPTNKNGKQAAAEIMEQISPEINISLRVFSLAEFAERKRLYCPLITDAVNEGVIVYER